MIFPDPQQMAAWLHQTLLLSVSVGLVKLNQECGLKEKDCEREVCIRCQMSPRLFNHMGITRQRKQVMELLNAVIMIKAITTC